MWTLYLVRSADGALYTGITTDLEKRLAAHSSNRGARRLRGRGPLEIVFSHQVGDRSTALRLEHRVKQLSKREKERLVGGEASLPILA